MELQKTLATVGGDIWASRTMMALWPYPAVVWGQHQTLITADDYRCFTRWLQPGDFLLTNSRAYFLSNLFIAKKNGTAFSHLAVYAGSVTGYRSPTDRQIRRPRRAPPGLSEMTPGYFPRMIIHATSDGVVVEDLFDLFHHVDWILALRPWPLHSDGAAIVDAALDRVGLPYNFDFQPEGPPASYCTELGAYCLERAGLKLPARAKSITSVAGIVFPFKCFRSDVYMADDFISVMPSVCCSLSCNEETFIRRSSRLDLRRSISQARDASCYDAREKSTTPLDTKRLS